MQIILVFEQTKHSMRHWQQNKRSEEERNEGKGGGSSMYNGGGNMWWMSTCKMNEICTLQCGMLVAAPSDFVCLLKTYARGSHPGGRDAMACSFPWQRNHSSSALSPTALPSGKPRCKCKKPWAIHGQVWTSCSQTHTPHWGTRKSTATFLTRTHTLDKTTRGRNRHRSSIVKTNYSVNKSQYTGLYMHRKQSLVGYTSQTFPRAQQSIH